jgi:PKD repeat protein
VQYVGDYGDHASSSDAVSEHSYEMPGTYEATLTVTDAQARRASTSRIVVARAVEGSWFHFGYNTQSHSAELRRVTLAQNGRTVTGELSGPHFLDQLLERRLKENR